MLVINFNGPELNELARHLAAAGRLDGYFRPYVNRNRRWEQALASAPFVGSAYAQTFGRRRIDDPSLLDLTREAGVLADVGAALVSRVRWLPRRAKHRSLDALHHVLRRAVSGKATRFARECDCVIAFTGFGQPAFDAARAGVGGKAVLSYPIAHHRHHRRVREEELSREPEFGAMWSGFEGWSRAYEEQVDEEIADADLILVGSRYVRDTFAGEGVDASRIKVVEYGVDTEQFSPRAQERTEADFKVVFAGQIGQRKGLSYLLRAYRAFARDGSRLTLIGNIVGSPQPLRAFAGLFSHIPHLPRAALAEELRQSDVFVFPSLVEGMPLTVLEAMASGLPVIVSPNGPADVVRDGIDGFIVPARDEAALQQRLDQLYRDRELRLAMGRSARARALEFTWGSYARRVERALDEVLPAGIQSAGATRSSAPAASIT